MLPVPERPVVATHWGTYRARVERGRLVALDSFELDGDPSPIAASMIDARTDAVRITGPMVRASFLERGHAAGGAGRGDEPFVAIGWDQALDIVAREIARVRAAHGNRAIYGGSAGWASAGRFHHAQSQIHRFLNCAGGYTRSVGNYSWAAAYAILPHVIGDLSGLDRAHTPWRLIAGHSRLLVMFGGMPHKNAQVASGGVGRHVLREALAAIRASGADLVSISPIRDDTLAETEAEWLALRPNTDVSLMLGLAHTLITEGLHDRDFLARYTVGFEQLRAYVLGESDGVAKTPEWAAAICEISATEIRALARRMAGTRTLITASWSLQRAHHGEQTYWMVIALACLLGQIGLPGGGFGFGYASSAGIGNPTYPFAWPSLPQGTNPVDEFIPVARIADMLLNPGQAYDFNGMRRRYPDIRLVYWAGGNPFHHHQDLNRLVAAWQRPEVVVVHESWWNSLARHADIVLPNTTQLERNDLVCSNRDRILAASHRVAEPAFAARDDYRIFADLAARLGFGEAFTEGRDEEGWIRHLYTVACQRIAEAGFELPEFDRFWRDGIVLLPEPQQPKSLLEDFRTDPEANALKTPSGRIELFSARIAGFGYDDCPGHPAWLEPAEWLGAPAASRFGLHLISNQPAVRLHSQYDNGSHSRAAKRQEREPIRLNPADAAARGIVDGAIVRVFNERGACLASAVLSDAVRPGVAQIATGAWYDPVAPGGLDRHGNPNVLTADIGTSRLGQGPSAHSCLVEIEAYSGVAGPPRCFEPPPIKRAAAQIRGT